MIKWTKERRLTSNELWFSRRASNISAGNNLLILRRKRFFRQQHEINLLNWKRKTKFKFDREIRKWNLTIRENISPSSSHALPPKQNISNHPSFPSRKPKIVWWTSHRWSSTKFFTTFLKILNEIRTMRCSVDQCEREKKSYSMNRSLVIASSGNGTDWSKSPRWGRQSSNDDLILQRETNNFCPHRTKFSFSVWSNERLTQLDENERTNDWRLKDQCACEGKSLCRLNPNEFLFLSGCEKLSNIHRAVVKMISRRDKISFPLDLHRLQHLRITDQLTFSFFFISSTTLFVFESITKEEKVHVECVSYDDLLLSIVEEIVNRC